MARHVPLLAAWCHVVTVLDIMSGRCIHALKWNGKPCGGQVVTEGPFSGVREVRCVKCHIGWSEHYIVSAGQVWRDERFALSKPVPPPEKLVLAWSQDPITKKMFTSLVPESQAKERLKP
jgi:hypothetical protein